MAYPAEIDDRLGPDAASRMARGEQLLFATHASRPAFGFGGPSFLFVLTFFGFATVGLGLHIGVAALIAVLPSSLGLALNRLSSTRAPTDSLLRRVPFGPVALVGTSRRILVFSLTDSGHGLRSLIAELQPDACVLTQHRNVVRITQVDEPDVELEVLSRSAAERLPGASKNWAKQAAASPRPAIA